MDVKKGRLFYSGKTKNLYHTDNPEQLILHFKDDIYFRNVKGKKVIKKKGELNNSISTTIFKFLKGYHIQSHFIKSLKSNEMLVKNLEMIPIFCIIWNFATSDLCKRYGLKNGKILTYSIIEYYLKNAKLRNPMINMDHVAAFGFASPREMEFIDKTARKINAVLKSFFDRRDLKLVTFKLKFGRFHNQILLGDAINPDTFHVWDMHFEGKQNYEPIQSHADQLDMVYDELKKRICC